MFLVGFLVELSSVGLSRYLRSYLWSKYGGARGLPLVTWGVCIILVDEAGLGLLDVVTQGNILVAKWVV